MSTRTLLTLPEVAAETGLSVPTLYRLLAPKGDLPCVRTTAGGTAKRKTRGHVRIQRSDLEAWIARHRSAPATEVARARGRDLELPGSDRYAVGR